MERRGELRMVREPACEVDGKNELGGFDNTIKLDLEQDFNRYGTATTTRPKEGSKRQLR